MRRQLFDLVPGIGLLILIGASAKLLSATVLPVNYLVIAIALGVLVSNVVGIPEWAEAGVGTHKLWLETGIVVMGARLALGQLVEAGPKIVLLVPAFVLFTILYVEFLSRKLFGLTDEMSTLVASGSSICGVSAIVAVAGGIKAREEHIAYAVATILLFDAVTLVAYPVVGAWLNLPDQVFGVWAGLSMYSTGPVTAAGFIYSDVAGQWATVTKLTRNVFIGFAAIGYSLYYSRHQGDAEQISNKLGYVWDRFPKFVVGFALVMGVASLGLLTDGQITSLKHAYKWAFLLAFAGLGLHIKVSDMRDTGVKPIAVVLLGLLTVSALSLVVVSTLF